MEKARLTSKGQLVIPAKIRRRRKLKKGTEFCFIEKGNDIILRPITDEFIDNMKGKFKTKNLLKALAEEKKKEREL